MASFNVRHHHQEMKRDETRREFLGIQNLTNGFIESRNGNIVMHSLPRFINCLLRATARLKCSLTLYADDCAVDRRPR